MDTVSNYTETLEKTIRDLLERQDDLIRTAFTDQLTGDVYKRQLPDAGGRR